MTTRKKKESFLVFEDWMRYARCFNDAEFRQFMINILNYYKGIEPILNTPNLQEVWNDIIDDLKINYNKKLGAKERGSNLKETNPKLNPKLKAMLNTIPDTEPDTEPNIKPDTELNTIPNTAGMVDGRCEMNDDKMGDKEMDDEWMIDNKISDVKTTLRVSSSGRIQHSHSIVDEMFS
jgi:hypothetical protein